MPRRRNQAAPFDFFAFQDIVTATTGILIIIALLLALSIGTTRINKIVEERKASALSQEAIDQINQKYQLLSSELEARKALEQEISEAKASIATYLQAEIDILETSNTAPSESTQYRRVILPTQSGLRRPMLVVAEQNTLRLLDQDGAQADMLDIRIGRTALQVKLAAHIGQSASSILILIKPSAFSHYDMISSLGLDSGKILFPYGYDIIPEDWEVDQQ